MVIVRRLVEDLDLDAEIVGCPTVREADGLACSSRNRRLGPADRQCGNSALRGARGRARALARAAMRTSRAVRNGDGAPWSPAEPRAKLDYAVVVDPVTFEPPAPLAGELRLLIAADRGTAFA